MISAGVLVLTCRAVRINLLYVVSRFFGNRCPNASQLCKMLEVTHALKVVRRTDTGASLFSWQKLKNLMQLVYRFVLHMWHPKSSRFSTLLSSASLRGGSFSSPDTRSESFLENGKKFHTPYFFCGYFRTPYFFSGYFRTP